MQRPCQSLLVGALSDSALMALSVFLTVIAVSSQAVADTASLDSAKEAVSAITAAGGVPGFRDLVGIAKRDGMQLSREECWQLEYLVQSLQTPEYSRQDLGELMKSKQESISDYYFEIDENEVGSLEGVQVQHRKYVLIGDGLKMLHKVWEIEADGSEGRTGFAAYDGDAFRSFDSTRGQGQVQPLQAGDLSNLVNIRVNPICSSMLLNSQARLGELNPGIDLAGLLSINSTTVYSQREMVDGHSCLVVSNMSTVAYLDPDLDFAVIRRESWRYHPPVGGWQCADVLTKYADFEDTGTGIILPTTIAYENTANGRRNVLTVKKMKINGGIDPSVFQTGIIPKGTLTVDVAHGDLTFIEGDKRSMEEALRRATPLKERPVRPGFSILLWVNGGVFVGVVLYFFSRRLFRVRSGQN